MGFCDGTLLSARSKSQEPTRLCADSEAVSWQRLPVLYSRSGLAPSRCKSPHQPHPRSDTEGRGELAEVWIAHGVIAGLSQTRLPALIDDG
jgi:hypothetical protein